MSNQNICNICGANYEYIAGRWKCPACGAYKTEELSNEEVTLLYNANQKLRLSDFDEAEKAFSDIIEKYPKNPNGYWGRLLSKYGIKYEDDFDGRKIPTCYATSIASVITDKDYLKAIELADADTKAYYQKQAEYIERVRKEWVSKASKEKPYDIFLCYKDSDLTNGVDRTKDSVAVQELYIHLTNLGYRVFYSRESLRDKVGEKYEPYIFNALSTAKVMLVYGSSSDYITSTWLKNEWTRYEKRMRAGEKKPNSLLVACDGFSPAELPKMLSFMQCFDATKPSFYSDLESTIKKICKEEKLKPVETPKPEQKKSKTLPIAIASVAVVIAIVLCIMVPNLLSDYGVSSLTNSQYNASLVVSNGELPSSTVFKIEEIRPSTQIKATIEKLVINKGNYHVYDMSLRDGNNEVDVNGNVIVTMSLPAGISADKAVVYYISGSTSEEIVSSVLDGKISFTTDHFSIYVIAEKATSTTPPDDDDNQNAGDNNGGDTDSNPDDNQGGGTDPTPDDNQGGSTDPNPDPEPPKTSSIIFNSNGGNGTMANQSVTVGVQTMLNECAFTKDGYTFGGWATTASGSASYTDGATFTATAEASTTLYAVWVPNSNSIIFNANGGSGFMDSISVETGKSVNLPANAFSKTGYTFMGWSDVQGNTVKYTDRQSITMTSSATITLYAVWGANENALVLKANNGASDETTIHIKTGESKNLPANTFAKSGYTFVGWSTSSGGSVEYTDGASYTMGDSSETLYAIWEANTNTVTFDANGGSGTMAAQQIKTDAKANLNANAFTLEGYTFAGWATTSTGNAVYADTASYTMGKESNYTLYAVWIKAAYTITYHMNNGSNSISNPAGYDVNSETITLADPTRDGYTFLGWYTDAAFQNKITSIPKGSTGNKEVYASWSANTNSINFNSNGGNGSMSAQQAKTDEKVTLKSNSFTRDGYTFAGWATTSGGTVAYADKANYTVGTSSSVTLYAVWTPINYTITYDLQGGSISGNKTSYNATMNSFTLPTPTKTGYSFEGWSGTGISGTQKDVTISKGSYGDRSYTANWKANEYTITLNANGGQVSPGTLTVAYNGNVEYPTPTKTGYTFGGWFNGNNEYTDGKWTYTNGITLTAKWNPNTNTQYIVNHYQENLDDSKYTLKETETLYGITATNVTPSRKSYTGFRAPTAQTITILADGTAVVDYYYARETFTVTLVTNGGDAIDPITRKYDQTISIPTATREGFTFGGWFTDVALSEQFTQTTVSSNTTLYAWWTEENKPGDFTYSGTTSITISGYSGSGTYLGVPGYIGGVPVTTIATNAFRNNTTLVEVVVPKTVTTIESAAFGGCSSLEKMTLPFVGKNRTVSSTVVKSSSNFDGGASTIFGYMFGGFTHYSSTSSWSTDYIYQGQECSGTYPYKAYYGIPLNLKEVIITDATGISANAFYGCSMIEKITLNESINAIHAKAFYGCNTLKRFNSDTDGCFVLPTHITAIGNYAFYGCGALTTISLNNAITTIGEGSFSGCSNLLTITNANTVKTIGEQAFYNCKKLVGFNSEDSIVIPNGVESINKQTFYGCSAISTITIPASVKTIGERAFAYSSSIMRINSDNENTMVLLEGVETIEDGAFYALNQIIEVVVPKSVTSIGSGAFGGFDSLEKITLPFVGKDRTVSASVVKSSSDFGKGAATIFGYIFGGFSHYSSSSSWSTDAIYQGQECSGTYPYQAYYYIPLPLREVVITDAAGISANAFYGCSMIEKITLNEEINKIYSKAFYGCSNLKFFNSNTEGEIHLRNITRIEDYAFINCKQFVSVDTTADVTYIGAWAFGRCDSLVEVNFGNAVASIGEYAFLQCENLQYFNNGSGSTATASNGSIGKQAFVGCVNLLRFNSNEDGVFNLPNGLTSIEESAFYNCVNIETISIDATVMSIGKSAFYNCGGIATVVYGGLTEENWNKISIGTSNETLLSAARTYTKGTMKLTLDLNNFAWATSGYKIAVVFINGEGSRWVEMTKIGNLYVCDIPDGYEASEFKFVRVQGNELNEANIKHQTNTFTTVMNTNYKLTSWSAAEKY